MADEPTIYDDVRAAARLVRDDTHECPYAPCTRRVSRQYLACRAHWMKVPAELRQAIYATVNGDLGAYLDVREQAIEAMNAR